MPSPAWSAAKAKQQLKWLQKNPHFQEKPASILEFLGAGYCNIRSKMRPGVVAELVAIFGEEVSETKIAQFRKAMFSGAIGIGKLLRPEELVLTPTGWVENQSLKTGDSVIGGNGKPTKIIGVFPHEDIQMYRVTFKDRTWIDCGADHLWEVSYKSSYGKFRSEIISTKVLSRVELQSSGGSYKYRIPIVLPVEFDQQEDLPIHPWALGALIANGGFTQGSISYSAGDDWNAEKLEDLLRPLGVHLSEGGYLKYTVCDDSSLRYKNSNPVMAVLDKLGLVNHRSAEKFIPEIYLHASIKDRLQLLRGLMDNDGSQFGKNTQVYSTSSKQLSRDVAELIRSLGGYCTVTEFDRNDTTEYQVHVNMDQVCPFSLPRKARDWSSRTNQRPAKSIISVDKIDRGPGICIKVDSADGLFVTKDFIVTHNTTMASVVIPYMTHWILCLKDPQDYYDLLPGSRIAFMQMSTTSDQAVETVFGDIKARIEYCEWFRNNYPFDPKFTKQLRFEKDIWILPGNSKETTFEGYNILGGILDEADSHKVTEEKDYAEDGYNTIWTRIDSRFGDKGFLLVVGQMKKASGFAARKLAEFEKDPDAHTVRMSLWESLGWAKFSDSKGNRRSFWYSVKRKEIIPTEAALLIKDDSGIIEIPEAYRSNFENNPEKALRDLAGIPPAAGDPFISLTYKIDQAIERWNERYDNLGSPVDTSTSRPRFANWFKCNTPLKRAIHIDLAYSAEGDALGLSMGHVSHVVEIDGDKKPYIVFDFLMRIHAAPGTEIMIQDVRRIIYELKDHYGFKIRMVTMDGFESTDTMQQLAKRRFAVDYVSIDRSMLPYEDLREALYEDRIEFPPYKTYIKQGSGELVEIAKKELYALEQKDHKVDHPAMGSKDVADTMAGVTFTLMGDRSFRRNVLSIDRLRLEKEMLGTGTDGYGTGDIRLPSLADSGMQAPLPPSLTGSHNVILGLPSRLLPKRGS